MKRRGNTLVEAVIVCTILVALMVPGAFRVWLAMTQSHDTITVTKTEVAGGRGGENFVYTTSDETFEVDDSWFEYFDGNPMAFRSRDSFGKILPGKTYKVRCRGQRWPFFSQHRNIVDLQEVQTQ